MEAPKKYILSFWQGSADLPSVEPRIEDFDPNIEKEVRDEIQIGRVLPYLGKKLGRKPTLIGRLMKIFPFTD